MRTPKLLEPLHVGIHFHSLAQWEKLHFSDDYIPRAHDEWDSCGKMVPVMTAMFLNEPIDGAVETHGQDARATKGGFEGARLHLQK
jgi:hypothetical protein